MGTTREQLIEEVRALRAQVEAIERAERERHRAEEERDRIARYLQLLLESTSEGVYAVDTEGRCTIINRAGAEALSYAPDELLGRNMHDLVHDRYPDGRPYPERECPIYRAFREGQPCRIDDDVFWRRDGTPLPVEYSAAPIVDQGRIAGAVVTFNDITARRAAEEAAERSRAQVANILESITDAFFALDHDFRFTYVNHQAGPLLQRDPADLLGKCVWDEFPEAVGTQFFEQYRRVATERVSASFEEYYPPLGKWFEVHAYPARDGLSVYFRDVTERKRAEQRLAAQHAVTRALADADTIQRAAPEILRTVAQTLEWDCGLLWLVDRQEGILHCVDLWVAPGIDAQEFVGLSRQRRLPPGVGLPGTVWATQAPYWVMDNEREPNFVRMAAARRAGLRSAFAVPVRTADEVVGALEFHSRARREEDPELLTVMAALGSQIGQFIERTRAEAALRESEARKDAILRSALDAIVSMDATGRIVEFNPAAEQMFGYSREEAIGAPLADLIIPPALRERHWQGLERYLATGVGPILNQRVEVTAMRRDGTEFPVELAITSVRVGDRETFTGYIRDITERRRVEEERSELLDRERAARAEAEEAAAVVHRLQLITDAALAHLRLDDLLGELLRRIRALLAGDTASILLLDERGEQLLVRAAIGLEEDVNEQVPVPVGKGFAGTIAATRQPLIIDDLRDAEVVTPILRRRVRSLIGVPLLIEGRAIGVLQVGTIEPHRFTEEDAHLLRLAADRIALAIEHARLFEAEREARAEAQAAVRAREEFLSIASHELKTPLTTVKGYAQLLGRLLAHGDVDPRRFATAVERLTVQVGRLEELVNDLLDVSRIQQGRLQPQPERFDLTELAREVIERFEQSAERKPQHRLVFESDGPVVGRWDPSRIDQVITNLVSNALKYSPQGGEVRVRVRQVDHAAEIAVSDQGIGITPEERQRLFKPFARGDTARQQFGGAGLGLYITAQIVERHGGTIGVESEPGKGSTFTVRLPLAPPVPAEEAPTRA